MTLFTRNMSSQLSTPMNGAFSEIDPRVRQTTRRRSAPSQRERSLPNVSRGRRNLVVVRAGDQSLHRQWIADNVPRTFDLFVSYYGEVAGAQQDGADFYSVERGPKFPAIAHLLDTRKGLIDKYDCVVFSEDDLFTDARSWNTLFDIFHDYRLDLAQPALTPDSCASWEFTRKMPDCLLRLTNFVEVMTPMFSRRALQSVGHTFAESVSGWGLDFLWPVLLPYPQFQVAIIDTIAFRHTRPLGSGTLYSVLSAAGISAGAEMEEVRGRFSLRPFQYREYGRVLANRPGH